MNNLNKFYDNINTYFKDYDINNLKKYIFETHQKDKVIADANNILNDNICFDNNWDMEQCKKIYKADLDLWNITPNGDEEWVYMLNRMEYIDKLIIAYYITLDEKYIDKWKEIIQKWMKRNNNKIKNEIGTERSNLRKIIKKVNSKVGRIFKVKMKISTIRTLDTAIRCTNVINGLMHLIYLRKIDINLQNRIIDSIKMQMKLMKLKYRKFEDTSNWGIIQMVAIMIITIIIDDTENEYYTWAKQKLETQLKLQVLNDGSNIEGSPMYHNQILICIFKLIYWLNEYSYSIEKNILDIAYKMMNYTYLTATPDSKQIEFGDSDRTDISDIVFMYSIATNRIDFNDKIVKPINAYYVYYFNTIYNEKKKIHTNNSRTVKEFENGNIIVKQNEKYTFMNNGKFYKLNDRYNGHRHADTGHFILYSQGKPFLVDSGRYTYMNCEDRKYLKSEYAHNTIIIDDNPFSLVKSSWEYETFTKTIHNNIKELDDFVIVEMQYSGHNGKCKINRSFYIFNEGIWIILDYIEYKGKHNCTKLYNYDKDVKLEIISEIIKANNNGKYLYMLNQDIDKRMIEDSIISLKYNEIEKNKKIITEKYFEDVLISIDALYSEEITFTSERNEDYIYIKLTTQKDKYKITIKDNKFLEYTKL